MGGDRRSLILSIPLKENDSRESPLLLITMIKSVVAAISFALIPSVALAQSDIDTDFLQAIQVRLDERYSQMGAELPAENKVILGLRVCLWRYKGATESDVNRMWASAIHTLPVTNHQDAIKFIAALDLAAVATYCPEFEGRK